jgi:hypothetical protein
MVEEKALPAASPAVKIDDMNASTFASPLWENSSHFGNREFDRFHLVSISRLIMMANSDSTPEPRR